VSRFCIPELCEHYRSWGDAAPGKGRCFAKVRPNDPEEKMSRDWFSVVQAQRCVFDKPVQERIDFDCVTTPHDEYGG
jgi:hypothetical protein